MINDSDIVVIVNNLHGIFIEHFEHDDNSWQLEELRSSAKICKVVLPTINIHMQIDPVIITAISTSQSVQHNRVETTRRQYQDVGGRVEIKETYYYYYLYDSKGRAEISPPQAKVDLEV